MFTHAGSARPEAGPFQRLLDQAARRPDAEALRSKRRGAWQVRTWSRLAEDARLAALGWASLGVRPGDRITLLGPLSANLIAMLFAADALGASVDLAAPQAEATLVGQTRFAFAEGTHELERLLRYRSRVLEAVVLGDPEIEAGDASSAGLALHSADHLAAEGRRRTGQGHALPDRRDAAGDMARIHREGGIVAMLPRHCFDAQARIGPDERVLGDFEPSWFEGLEFLAHQWPRIAPRLLIPEPGGDAVSDRREAHATTWLAPCHRLAEVIEQFDARVPTSGLGAAAVRSVLRGGHGLLTQLSRARIVAGLGLADMRQVHSDAGIPDATRRVLESLGLSLPQRSATSAGVSAGGPASAIHATGHGFEGELVGSAS